MLVPAVEIARQVQDAKAELRREWAVNIDRAALERAITDAKIAADEAKAVAAASRKRFAFALACLALIAIILASLISYTRESRARIEHLERMQE